MTLTVLIQSEMLKVLNMATIFCQSIQGSRSPTHKVLVSICEVNKLYQQIMDNEDIVTLYNVQQSRESQDKKQQTKQKNTNALPPILNQSTQYKQQQQPKQTQKCKIQSKYPSSSNIKYTQQTHPQAKYTKQKKQMINQQPPMQPPFTKQNNIQNIKQSINYASSPPSYEQTNQPKYQKKQIVEQMKKLGFGQMQQEQQNNQRQHRKAEHFNDFKQNIHRDHKIEKPLYAYEGVRGGEKYEEYENYLRESHQKLYRSPAINSVPGAISRARYAHMCQFTSPSRILNFPQNKYKTYLYQEKYPTSSYEQGFNRKLDQRTYEKGYNPYKLPKEYQNRDKYRSPPRYKNERNYYNKSSYNEYMMQGKKIGMRYQDRSRSRVNQQRRKQKPYYY